MFIAIVFCSHPGLLEELTAEATAAAAKFYSENSWKTRHSQWRKYLDFCNATHCVALPCSATTLCAYIAFLARTLKYTSICNYVSALRTLHKLNDASVDAFECFVVKATLKGYKRILGVNIVRKYPVTVSMLKQIVGSCADDCESGLIATLLVGFFTFMRKSSLLPRTVHEFNHGGTLCRGSIGFTEEGAMLKLTQTKTIQFQERVLYIPLVSIPDSILCPVKALRVHFARHHAPQDGPVFMDHCNSPITGNRFNKWLKRKVQALDYDPVHYSCHSLRRGGATFAHNSGAPLELIQAQGDWCSMAVLVYLTRPVSLRVQIARLMAASID